ncbi:MAG: hypothetical protein K6E96_00380 [Bacteroidales bacterium]|nr:hypothetical protein [Bacteroidales bacterium]
MDTTDEISREICVWSNGNWTTDWMQKYVDYARGYDQFYTDERIMDTWREWGLAYIDNDTIPEMILLCSCEATGNKVLTIRDGKVSEWNSWRCSSSYIPRSGLIENHDGHMGYYYDRVFRLENGVFTELFNHSDRFHDVVINDSLVTIEYYCCFDGDTALRLGSDIACEEYYRQKDSIYTSVGESIEFYATDSQLSTDLFDPESQPTLPDGVNKITLSVR